MSDVTGIDLEELMSTVEVDEDETAADAGLGEADEGETEYGDTRDVLSELAAGVDEEPEDGEDEDDDEEADDDEGTEAEGDTEPAADDEEADDDESDEQDDKVAELEALVQEERLAKRKLELQILQQQVPKQPRDVPEQQRYQPPDPQFVSAVKALMLGGDPEKQQEALGRVPPHVVDNAIRFVRDANERMVQYEIEPVRRYHDQIAPFVAEQIAAAIKPYKEARFKSQAQDALAPYKELLEGEEDRAAIREILDDLPHGELNKRVKYAVEIHMARKNSKRVVKTSRQLADKGRDLKSQKASRRRTGKRRNRKGKKALPTMDGFNMAAYADQLKGVEIDPSEYEDLISG